VIHCRFSPSVIAARAMYGATLEPQRGYFDGGNVVRVMYSWRRAWPFRFTLRGEPLRAVGFPNSFKPIDAHEGGSIYVKRHQPARAGDAAELRFKVHQTSVNAY